MDGTADDDLWIAYYADWSDFAVFRSEVECLRYAVERSMTVAPCPVGSSVKEVL